MQGIITAFDKKGGFGLIDAEDGEIVLFNRDNLQKNERAQIVVGARVQFDSRPSTLGLHADSVTLDE